jgi:uncharacterized protein with GYD domain
LIRAVMLIKSGGRVPKAVELARRLKQSEKVKEAYAVFGRYDVIAFFESEDVKSIFRSLSRATEESGIMVSESLIEVPENQQTEEYGKGPFAS